MHVVMHSAQQFSWEANTTMPKSGILWCCGAVGNDLVVSAWIHRLPEHLHSTSCWNIDSLYRGIYPKLKVTVGRGSQSKNYQTNAFSAQVEGTIKSYPL